MIIILSLVLLSYRYNEDGDSIPFNATKNIPTRSCCEGYLHTDIGCIRDFCKYFNCNEDPNSRCVMVERCGDVFPIFVDDRGILSEKCTQPEMSEARLCPDDVCSAESKCTAEGAVCLANGCDCSSASGPFWQLKNLEVAQC